jgi:nesprin-1
LSEITSKYQNLTKQAQDMYDKEKDMVEKHEKFMDAGNEFMTWLKLSREKLDKCSETTGDKESLASRSSLLKVLDADKKVGFQKLQEALQAAADACKIAMEDDQEIIEEEVAFLQDEYDQYNDDLVRCKSLLEGGIVKWTDYQELYQEALDWLGKTEVAVQGYNRFQNSIQEKRKILEEFQTKLQSIFDWQKELDMLNRKGQMLLETCADSRVSNAITQLSTKYQALLSLAKEVVRRLEVHFQEHISTMHFVRNFKHGLTKQESNSPLSKLLRTHMKILKINLILSK